MNKTFTKTLLTLTAAILAQNAWADSQDEDLLILTFEDADYKGDVQKAPFKPAGMTSENYWSSLIDNPQYMGDLLYSEEETQYRWCDAVNTNLCGYLNGDGYGIFEDECFQFWYGGSAISNYVTNNYAGCSYSQQLSAYAPSGNKGGANGSSNFLVCYGNNNEAMAWDSRAELMFDGEDGEFQYAYINLNAMAIDAALNGASLPNKPTASDYVDIIAEPFDAEGNSLGEGVKFRALDGSQNYVLTSWTKWDLSGLGKCRSVKFDVRTSIKDYYGPVFPTYFLLDNIAVKKSQTQGIASPVIDGTENKENVIYTITGIRVKEANQPGIYIVNGKKIVVK